MTNDASMDVSRSEWPLLSERLQRGLVHSMNNRLTALGAHVELAAMGDEAVETGVLREELLRVQALNAQLSAIATRAGSDEPLEVASVIERARAILLNDPRQTRERAAVGVTPGLVPVRVTGWMFLRLVLLLMDAAGPGPAGLDEEAPQIAVEGDDDEIRMSMQGTLGLDGRSLASRCHATVHEFKGHCTVTLPTLLAVRRQERGG